MARIMRPQVKSAIQLQDAATAAQAGLSPSECEEIAKVAYSLFERRGGSHGNDQQDWFEAERIVRQRRNSSVRQVSSRRV